MMQSLIFSLQSTTRARSELALIVISTLRAKITFVIWQGMNCLKVCGIYNYLSRMIDYNNLGALSSCPFMANLILKHSPVYG